MAKSSAKDDEQQSEEAGAVVDDNNGAADTAPFAPTRTFWLTAHSLWATRMKVLDLTEQMSATTTSSPSSDGSTISDDLRDAAQALSEDNRVADRPALLINRDHWWSSKFTILTTADTRLPALASASSSSGPAADATAAAAAATGDDGGGDDSAGTRELASWKHPLASTGAAVLTFAGWYAGVTHPLAMAPPSRMRRANAFVMDSVQYVWECTSKMKSNRMTLSKTLAGRKVVCARYAQRWAAFRWGGVLLVDGDEVDVLVAVVTCFVMLKKMQQRAAEMAD